MNRFSYHATWYEVRIDAPDEEIARALYALREAGVSVRPKVTGDSYTRFSVPAEEIDRVVDTLTRRGIDG